MQGPRRPYNLEIIESCLSCLTREKGLFCNLPHSALALLNSIRQASYFPRGVVLFTEGESPRGILALCSGSIKLTASSREGHALTLRTVEPGEVLGLSSVIGDCPHMATAETLSACQVGFLPKIEFMRLMRSNSDISIHVARHLSMELHHAWHQSRLVALASDTSAKVAQFLVDHAERHGQAASDGMRIPLNMTHDEIGKNIGASRESVSRILKALRNQGIISINRGTVTILQAVALFSLISPP